MKKLFVKFIGEKDEIFKVKTNPGTDLKTYYTTSNDLFIKALVNTFNLGGLDNFKINEIFIEYYLRNNKKVDIKPRNTTLGEEIEKLSTQS